MSGPCRLSVTARRARDGAEVEAALALRRRVFCDEQGVSPQAEFDDLDEEAAHVVAIDESGVLATCRLRIAAGSSKLERMAVERRLRGNGVGSVLLEAAEREAASDGATGMVLHAQTRAEGFYAGAGYRPEGAVFEEEGIPHVLMRKPLDAGSGDSAA